VGDIGLADAADSVILARAREHSQICLSSASESTHLPAATASRHRDGAFPLCFCLFYPLGARRR
jgi:hypothetical protein